MKSIHWLLFSILLSMASPHAWAYENATFEILTPDADFSVNSPACVNEPLTFTNTSTGYTSVIWNFGDGSSPSNVVNPTHIYTSPGTYTVSLTAIANGASDTHTQQVVIHPEPGSIINGILSMCANDVVRTYAAGTSGIGYTYQWTATGSISNPTGTGSAFNVTWGPSGGTLELITTNSYGCSSVTTEQITVVPVPSPPINGPTHSCTNFSSNYSVALGSFGSSYSWSVSGGGTINGSSTGPSVNVSWTAPGGTLTLTETTAQGCTGSTNIQVTIGPIPNPMISGPSDLCNGLTTSHFVNPASFGSSYQWSVSGGSINGPSNGPNVSVTWGPSGGVLTLTETNSLGCVGSTDLIVESCCDFNVVVNTKDACLETCDGWAEVVNPQPGHIYDWGNGPVSASAIIDLCPGTYSLTVTDATNCSVVQNFTIGVSGFPQAATAFNAPVNYGMELGRRIYLFDVDYDGFPDLVSARNQGPTPYDGINIRINDQNGGFNAAPSAYLPNLSVESLAYNDVDGDGFNDIVAQTWTSFVVLINNGNGVFTVSPQNTYADPAGFKGELECGDLNADGFNDVLTLNGQTQEFYIYYHNTSPTAPYYSATPNVTLNAPAAYSYWEAKLVDFDQDNDIDIVSALGGGTNEIIVFQSNGTVNPFVNNMTPTDLFATAGSWPRGLDVVELGNQGSTGLDFVSSLQLTQEVIVLFDAFTANAPLQWVRYPAGGDPVGQAIGDMDNDGDLDVIVAVYSPTSFVRVFLNDGSGALATFNDYPTPLRTTEVAVANLNEDCCLDIATANWLSNPRTSSVLLNVCGRETEIIEGSVFCDENCTSIATPQPNMLVQLTEQVTNNTFFLPTGPFGGYTFTVPFTGNNYVITLPNGNYAPCSGPIGPVPSNSFGNDFWVEDTCLVDVVISGGYAGGAFPGCPVPTTPCEDIIWDYTVTFTNQSCFPMNINSFQLTLPNGNHQIISVSDLTQCGTTNVINSNIMQGLPTTSWIPTSTMPPGACYTATIQVQFGSGLTSTPTATGIANYFCETIGNTSNDDVLIYNSSCSCDPNFKTVYPLGCGTKNAIGIEELTYTIHFQNIGSGPATDIRIEDQLDTDLDWSTFTLVGASHSISSVLIDPNGLMTIEFNGINLASLATGWFKYKMTPLSSVSNLTTISNEASIYFDSNPAVVTNTVSNLIVLDPLAAEVDPACAVVYLGYTPAECTTLTTSTTGGVAPYSYNWSTGETTASINACPTSKTLYSVTITDDVGCTTMASATVHVEDIRCGRDRVVICHQVGRVEQEECVLTSAVPTYLANGGRLGSCELVDPCAPPASRELWQGDIRIDAGMDIQIYPNPNQGQFTLDLNIEQSERLLISLTNLLGQQLYQWQEQATKGRFTTQLDISNFPEGTYFITIDNGKQRHIQKVVKN